MRGKLPGSHWDWQSGADFQFSKWQTEDAAEAPEADPEELSDAAQEAGTAVTVQNAAPSEAAGSGESNTLANLCEIDLLLQVVERACR